MILRNLLKKLLQKLKRMIQTQSVKSSEILQAIRIIELDYRIESNFEVLAYGKSHEANTIGYSVFAIHE